MTLAMLPGMTEAMTPHVLVGWIVREGIIGEGMTFTDASRRWGVSLPTLNRVMNGVPVSARFYAVIERHLGLPRRFLTLVIEQNAEAIRKADVDRAVRDFVLLEMDAAGAAGARKHLREA